jgi:hypothetical protein
VFDLQRDALVDLFRCVIHFNGIFFQYDGLSVKPTWRNFACSRRIWQEEVDASRRACGQNPALDGRANAAGRPAEFGALLEAVLYRGELPRGDAAGIVGTVERQARRVVSALIEEGVLISESRRAPLRMALPATLASRWMPGFLPEQSRISLVDSCVPKRSFPSLLRIQMSCKGAPVSFF